MPGAEPQRTANEKSPPNGGLFFGQIGANPTQTNESRAALSVLLGRITDSSLSKSGL